MAKTYKVSGPHEFLGHKPGDTFDGPLPAEIDEELAVAAGAIEAAGDQEEEKLVCAACKTEGKKRPPSFPTLTELQTHYAEKHPALTAPEKEENDG